MKPEFNVAKIGRNTNTNKCVIFGYHILCTQGTKSYGDSPNLHLAQEALYTHTDAASEYIVAFFVWRGGDGGERAEGT